MFFIKNILTPHAKIHSKDISKEDRLKRTQKQAQAIIDLVWMFLHAQDKKELKDKLFMKIEAEDFVDFLKTLDEKLKEYSDFVKNEDKTQVISCDINEVYAFLSKEFSWTFDHMKEMEELELLKAIKHAIKIKKDNQRVTMNSQVLTGSVVAGNKKASKIYNDINKEADQEKRFEQMKVQPATTKGKFLTDEQLRRVVNGRRG